MTASDDRYGRDYVDRLGAELKLLRAEVNALKAGNTFMVPTLDADPAVDDPCNFYGYGDGRMMHKTPDGVIHQIVPTDDADWHPDVPTRSTDPAASTGIDIWVRGDTRKLCVRTPSGVWRIPFEGTGTSANSATKVRKATTNKAKPADKPPRRKQRTFDATWSGNWCAGHDRWEGGEDEYGYWSATHGERKVMIGFDDAAIRTELVGAKIIRVEVFLANVHAYRNSGVDIHLGGHSNSGRPGSYSGIVARSVSRRHFGKSEAGWVTVSDWFGPRFRDGVVRGLIIDQPSRSRALYGAVNANRTKVRFTYRS